MMEGPQGIYAILRDWEKAGLVEIAGRKLAIENQPNDAVSLVLSIISNDPPVTERVLAARPVTRLDLIAARDLPCEVASQRVQME